MTRFKTFCACALLLAGSPHLRGATTVTDHFQGYTIQTETEFFGAQSVTGPFNQRGYPLYDYSVDLVRPSDAVPGYLLFAGGRWRSARGDGDHVLKWASTDGHARSWVMPQGRPEFWHGKEDGTDPKGWTRGNYLQAQAFIDPANGKWAMYVQYQVDRGQPLDEPGLVADTGGGSRIGLATSDDGNTWRKKLDASVVTHISDPTHTFIGDEEFVYAPWDAEGKKYWLYYLLSRHHHYLGIRRIRSDRADAYDETREERVTGFSQIGNQIGYLETSGHPLLVRITSAKDVTGRWVPALQYSLDGLRWGFGEGKPGLLAGSTDTNLNRNLYFLGIATVAGLGSIHRTGTNTFETIYGGATCNTPIVPEIFNSDIGVGSIRFTVTPPAATQ
jgi:hypothetical protein